MFGCAYVRMCARVITYYGNGERKNDYDRRSKLNKLIAGGDFWSLNLSHTWCCSCRRRCDCERGSWMLLIATRLVAYRTTLPSLSTLKWTTTGRRRGRLCYRDRRLLVLLGSPSHSAWLLPSLLRQIPTKENKQRQDDHRAVALTSSPERKRC